MWRLMTFMSNRTLINVFMSFWFMHQTFFFLITNIGILFSVGKWGLIWSVWNDSIYRRFRRLVSQMEPEVHEVSRLFRSVLNEFVDEANANEDTQDAIVEKQQRSKSLSFDVFRTKLQRQLFRGSGLRGSRGNLQQELDWSDEEDGEREEEEVIKARARKGRSRSMPEIGPVEQSAQAWGKGGRACNNRGLQPW